MRRSRVPTSILILQTSESSDAASQHPRAFPLLQAVVRQALTNGGFETEILSSGEEALALFKGGTKNYRALVTDVDLNGSMNGWELARQIREVDSGFPVIYTTGAAADEWGSQGVSTASFWKNRLRRRSSSPPSRNFSKRAHLQPNRRISFIQKKPAPARSGSTKRNRPQRGPGPKAYSVGYTPRSTSSKWFLTDSLQRQAQFRRTSRLHTRIEPRRVSRIPFALNI